MTYKILKSNPRRNTHEFFVDTEEDLQHLPKEPASKALVAITGDNYICNNNNEGVKLKNSCCDNNEKSNIQFGKPIFINAIYDDSGDQTYAGFTQIVVSYFPFEDPAQVDNILFLKNSISGNDIYVASGLYCALGIDTNRGRIKSIVEESDTNNKVGEENIDFIKKNKYIYFQVPKNNLTFGMDEV